MPHWKRTLAVVGLMLAAIGAGSIVPAEAQVRPALVRDVDTPALSPFRTTISVSLVSLNEQKLVTKVPAGKRLVLEHISYWGFSQVGQSLVFAALRTGQFGPMATILQINPPHASATPSSFVLQDGAMPVKAYFEAGEEVWVTVTKTSGNAQFEIAVQGYLVTP